MKVSVVVPIKLNNERLPNKTFLRLHNKPLCEHIFDTLVKFKQMMETEFTDLKLELYCFCSDETICDYLPNPYFHFIPRDPKLDSSETLINDVLQSFSQKIKSDIYILTHITAPYVKCSSFYSALRKMIDNQRDSIFSVRRIQTFCDYNGQPINYDTKNIVPTQNLVPVLEHTSSFFMFTRDVLQSGRRIGDDYEYYELSPVEYIDIDTKEDLEFARMIYC